MECLWSWGSPRLIGGVLKIEGVKNGVSLDVYEGEIQAKKNVKKEGEKRERREERKNEEIEKDERFSRSKWEWSLLF